MKKLSEEQMMKYSQLKDDMGYYCRECLNEAYDIELKPDDCKYFMYPILCHHCGMVKSVVTDIRTSKKIKLILGFR